MKELDYELLDYGNGQKLERFGPVKLIRPEAGANHQTRFSNWQADSICQVLGGNRFAWDPMLKPWIIERGKIKLELRLSQSKNIGVFPEQEANWTWLANQVKPNQKILNLFAYTGAASLACASLGAQVCHVDASKSTVQWASENARLSGLSNIRWIVEDAMVFLRREVARHSQYDGIILDPPPFGQASKGRFVFNQDIAELLKLCQQVLKAKPDFFLLNSYAVNLKPRDLKNLVAGVFQREKIETGELKLKELAISTYARF